MHHITTPWFLCLAKYLGSCSSEQLKVCLNWGVRTISLIFSRAFTFTPRFFILFYLALCFGIWLPLFTYLKLTSTELELTEFETSFCDSVYFLICSQFSYILSSNSSEVHNKNLSSSFTLIACWFCGVWEVRCFWEGYEAYGLFIGMH